MLLVTGWLAKDAHNEGLPVNQLEEDLNPVESKPGTENRRRLVWIITGLCIIAFTLLRTLPWNARIIPVPEDDSWDLALNLFASRHDLCGQDYIFTFGPLGFIYDKTFFPLTFGAKLAMQGLICSLTTAVLILQGKRLFSNPLPTVLWIFCLLGLYGFFADVFFLAVPLLLINQHFLLDDRSKAPSAESLTLVGLLALTAIVKFTFFVAAVWVIAFIALDELFVKRKLPVLSITFAVSGVLLWLLSGQPVNTLVAYIASSLPVTSGHSEAMTAVYKANWVLPVVASIASAALLLLSFTRLSYDRLKRGLAPAVLALSGVFF